MTRRSSAVRSANPDLLVLRSLIEREVHGGSHAGDSDSDAASSIRPGRWAADARSHLRQAQEAADEACRHRQARATLPPNNGSRRDQSAVLVGGDRLPSKQREAAKQPAATSWLSLLFGLGGFGGDAADAAPSIVPQPAPRQPRTPAEPPFPANASSHWHAGVGLHWIPEDSVAKEGVRHPAPHDETHTGDDWTCSSLRSRPDVLQPPLPSQSVVDSLGLILGTNQKQEVFFISALPGSPADALTQADEAKLQEGDVLFAIDGEKVLGMPITHVVSKLAGPAESVANLHFLRGDTACADQEPQGGNPACKRTFVALIREVGRGCQDANLNASANRSESGGLYNVFDGERKPAEVRSGRQRHDARHTGEGSRPGMHNGAKMSEEMDAELKALKARLSTKTRLSLGHSMLRRIENSVDSHEMHRLLATRHDEDVTHQLQSASELARQRYKDAVLARKSLQKQAVGKVREYAKEAKDRERRVGEYLGLRAPSGSERSAITSRAPSDVVSSRASSLALDDAPWSLSVQRVHEQPRDPAQRIGAVGLKPEASEFDNFLNNLKEGGVATRSDSTYAAVSTPAKSTGLVIADPAPETQFSCRKLPQAADSSTPLSNSADSFTAATCSPMSSRGQEQSWIVHCMVYEVENLPAQAAGIDPYVCLSVLGEEATASGREYRICHNRSNHIKHGKCK